MNSKKKTPEFDIINDDTSTSFDDTPTTSDGECPCIDLGRKDRQCSIHGEV